MHSVIAESSQWTPAASAPAFWARADSGVAASGGLVDSWGSRVGSGSVAQSTSGAKPAEPVARSRLANKLACGFDGTDDVLSGSVAADQVDGSGGWSVCVVVDLLALKNTQGFARLAGAVDSGTNGVQFHVDVGGFGTISSPDLFAWNLSTTSAVFAANTAYAIVVRSTAGGSISLDLGTISSGSISWSTPTLSAISGTYAAPAATGRYPHIGTGRNGTSSRLSGYVGETIWWGRQISAADLASLKTYLRRYA